jgi:hypothetical protein
MSAQSLPKAEKGSYRELATLDSIARLRIDPEEIYVSKDKANQMINDIVNQEYFLLTDSTVSKSIMSYNYYSAKKYGNRIQCVRHYTKKDLLKRWLVKPVYKTVRDTIFEEKKDLTGVNFGSNHSPVGTRKPIIWHTRYRYDSCFISLLGCSNMDGEDNFFLYTAGKSGKDTLCNIRAPRSAEYGDPLYKKNIQCSLCSQVYIKIYNNSNVHASPGACSAFLLVRPKYPIVVAKQKIKRYQISQLK